MSYARFSPDSDVYVIAHINGFIQCCGCLLGDEWNFHTPEAIVEHLHDHVAAGQTVPERLLDESVYATDKFVPRQGVTDR